MCFLGCLPAANLDLGPGPADAGPVANAERIAGMAAPVNDPANDNEDQDPAEDSDDSSDDEACVNTLTVAQRVRLRHRVVVVVCLRFNVSVREPPRLCWPICVVLVILRENCWTLQNR